MERVSFELEVIFRASPKILYRFLTTPDCLILWFCDEVDITDNVYSFSWGGSEELYTLVESVEDERLKFKKEDAESDEEYLEIRMRKSPVTAETILEITDFCDADDVDDDKNLWITQLDKLKTQTGG